MPDPVDIPLASMLCALRQEIRSAEEEAEGKDPQFKVGDIELELQVGITKEGEGDVGIKFWVISLGGKASVASERVQTIRLRLTPIGRDVVVHDTPGGRPK